MTSETWSRAESTRTDDEGRYHLVGLLPGEHDLVLRGAREELAELAHDFAEGEEFAWSPVLGPRESQAVRVLDESSRPVVGAIVMFTERTDLIFQGDFMRHRTDTEGLVVVPELPPERAWYVTVHVPMEGGDSFLARPNLRLGPLSLSSEELVLRLTPETALTCTISGRLVDARGRPWRGEGLYHYVAHLDAASPLGSPEDGRFQLTALPAGRHELRRSPEGEVLAAWDLKAHETLDVGDVLVPPSD